MSDVVDKVQKLLALAASTNENEARNAAVEAAKLIREHKLAIVAAPTPAAKEQSVHVNGKNMDPAMKKIVRNVVLAYVVKQAFGL
jgi:hypothetical protein